MAVLSIQNLLLKFGAGKSPRSADYIDLIDTLADDRNAVYFSSTVPEDTVANPLWFNTSTNILSVYSNAVWSNIDLSLFECDVLLKNTSTKAKSVIMSGVPVYIY
jgi:hypothetical protein